MQHKNDPLLTTVHQMVRERQEFEQDGHHHFVGFQPHSTHFSLKYDVIDAILRGNEKMKVQYLKSVLFDFFEILGAVRT